MSVVFAPVTSINELADTFGQIAFAKLTFVDGKHHLCDDIIAMIPRQMPRDQGMDAIQKPACREMKGGNERRKPWDRRYCGPLRSSDPK